jgi:hypothetical protein
MTCYNMQRKVDRERLRLDRTSELEAIKRGEWPRDIDDTLRWKPRRGVEPVQHAEAMCRLDLEYLDDLDQRIRNGDADVTGHER